MTDWNEDVEKRLRNEVEIHKASTDEHSPPTLATDITAALDHIAKETTQVNNLCAGLIHAGIEYGKLLKENEKLKKHVLFMLKKLKEYGDNGGYSS